MKKIICLMSLLLLTGCTTIYEKSPIEELDDGSFKLSCINENEWSGAFLSADLIKEAEEFCLKKGKHFERVELKDRNDGRFNYTSSQLIFRCK